MASDTGNESTNGPSSPKEAERPPIEPIRLPTVEEIRGQDIWNNCAMRSVVSGVMVHFFSPLARKMDSFRKELRRLKNRLEVERWERDMQAAQHALEDAKKAEVIERQAEEIDELKRLLEVNHIEDRVAIRNYFYGGKNASSSTEEGDLLPLNVRFQKVADKLMEFSVSSSQIPEISGGSRLSKNSFVEKCINILNSGSRKELMKLPDIGDVRATGILELRKKSPEPFRSFDDLSKIGLSDKQIRSIKIKLVSWHVEEFF